MSKGCSAWPLGVPAGDHGNAQHGCKEGQGSCGHCSPNCNQHRGEALGVPRATDATRSHSLPRRGLLCQVVPPSHSPQSPELGEAGGWVSRQQQLLGVLIPPPHFWLFLSATVSARGSVPSWGLAEFWGWGTPYSQHIPQHRGSGWRVRGGLWSLGPVCPDPGSGFQAGRLTQLQPRPKASQTPAAPQEGTWGPRDLGICPGTYQAHGQGSSALSGAGEEGLCTALG